MIMPPKGYSLFMSLAFLILVGLVSQRAASDDVFLWIEAENYISAASGITVIKGDYTQLSTEEQRNGQWFQQRSGWKGDSHLRVSGKAYIEQTAGVRKAPNTTSIVKYEVSVPKDGNYYFWLRCDSPPPCTRFFELWLDTRAKVNIRRELIFAHWNIWSWWPWGGQYDTGVAQAYSLTAGKHTLLIGNMSYGLRLDKILVTNDPEYVPFGPNQHYYTGTFEPPEIRNAHDWIRHKTAKATGWTPSLNGNWETMKEQFSGNHYYFVSIGSCTETIENPAYALIRDLECAFFEANLSLVLQPTTTSATADAMLIFSFLDPQNFNAVRFTREAVELLHVRKGECSVIQAASCSLTLRAKPYRAIVRRNRTGLSVELDAREVLSARLPIPGPGSIGIGSYSGGVGFDNIEVLPLDDPDASFDFTCRDDKALPDWSVIREGREIPWTGTNAFNKGDVVLYKAPFWSNSEISAQISDKAKGAFSILFPYVDSSRYIEVKFNKCSNGSVEVIRHIDDSQQTCGIAKVDFYAMKEQRIAVQSVKGMLAVFLNGNRLIETNEYNLLVGTVGIQLGNDVEYLPIERIEIKRKDMIFDNFAVDGSGTLSSNWLIQDGTWKVASILEGDFSRHDGQLVALGKGTVLTGEETWREYFIQTSIDFSESTKVSLVGWANREGSLELFCAQNKIRLRKVAYNDPITLAMASIPDLSSGWHRIGLIVANDHAIAEVDGIECLRVNLRGTKGRAGLRNYGDFVAFDNLTIHIISKDKKSIPKVENIDSNVFDIETDIMK
jgi:hypothetical protein